METINLDIIPGRTPPVCHASQFDDGRVIRFNLFEGGTAFTLDGSELLTFAVRKPDTNVVTVSVTNTSDSYVDIVTTEQMCAVAGASLCELTIEKGAVTIGTTNVIMAVEKDPLDGGLPSASQINDLASQIAALLADLYDGTAVIFDNIPTAGHVAPTTVTSDGIATALSAKANVSSLSTVATSGDYNDLSNLPTIPTNLDNLGDVSITSAASGDALTFDGNDWVNTPLELDALNDVALTTPASGDAVVYDGADWVNTALATVATSGSYNDLSDKPTINTTYTISAGPTMPASFPLPAVIRRDNVVQVVFGIQLPAGTYASTDTLWNISPKPPATSRGSIALGSTFPTVNITANGEIRFNGAQTLNAATWFIGQIMYLTDD